MSPATNQENALIFQASNGLEVKRAKKVRDNAESIIKINIHETSLLGVNARPV